MAEWLKERTVRQMSLLFSPMNIAGLELRNRFVHSATQEYMATAEGEVTDDLVRRYAHLAKGEVGLIIPGDVYVHPMGKSRVCQTGIHSDAMIPGLTQIVQAVHENGGKIIFQLSHAGRQSSKGILGRTPLGPSSFGRDPVHFVKPREMTEEDIRDTIDAFGKAARRAMEASADGIRLHAAHGYLINQFLSPYFNRRSDAWGGSDENRFRFLEEVFSAVKRSVPDSTPILVKLNTHDHTPGPGITPPLSQYYARRLAELGVHGFELSSGTAHYSFMNMCRGDVPVKELVSGRSFWERPVAKIRLNQMVGKFDLYEGYHVEAAELIRPVVGNATIFLVGGMRTVAFMEEALRKGHGDFISMSRPFIREPYLVKRIRQGKTDRASCVSCNKCLARLANKQPVKCDHRPDSSN